MGQQGFWDVDECREKLAGKQDILNRLNALVPWETFRPILSRIHEKPRKSKAGRKPIDNYAITNTSVHDSQVLGALLDAGNTGDGLWANSAYSSTRIVEALTLMGFDPHINERAYRHRPLAEKQKAANRERSNIRAKVEHIFGDWVMTMCGKLVRTIGLARAQVNLGLKNLTYNL